VIYGASHTAADIYPDVLRQRLQTRFGEAGLGFMMPAKPLKHYTLPGIAFERSFGWSGVQVKASAPKEDHYGLAGMYLLPSSRRARSSLVTRPHAGLSGVASHFELFYWKQPGGGRFKVSIDGKSRTLSAAGKAGPAYQRWTVPESNHRVELSVRGDGPVRIFGMSIERKKPGVIIDTLGIPGSRASAQLLWDEELQREHLQRRRPDLIVLAYGTNESGDDDHPIADYAESLRKVLTRIRRAVPAASCLLIGPSDRPVRTDDGTYVDRPRTGQVIETQRQVSFEFGCGFFDLVSFMGGPLSMLDWCDGEPPFGASDHVHFTSRGYQALGNVLHDALMASYDAPASQPELTQSSLPSTAELSCRQPSPSPDAGTRSSDASMCEPQP
jgi:lysophospholipase L1-like esterase